MAAWRMLVAVGLLLVGLVVAVLGLLGLRDAAHAAHSSSAAADAALGRERVELRTRSSRMYESPGGGLVARVFGGPVDVEDAHRHSRPIDNTLRRTAQGMENTANSVRMILAEDLGQGPVRVQDEARSSTCISRS